jgi:UDP-N-acetylglucosamine acyltransferase
MATPSPRIHPTACVAAGASLHPTVEVGPFAVIEDQVEIGANCVVGPHCVLRRWTRIGSGNTLASHVVLGEPPQHKQYDGSETWLVIGDDNVLREGVTIHRAFQSGAQTRVGSRCYLMNYAHVAHDCVVGDEVTMTNLVALGGHTVVGDGATIGGATVVHQFVRIGQQAMLSGTLGISKDVLPFTLVAGEPVRHYRLNSVGLRRRGITGDRYKALERACRGLREGKGLPEATSEDTPEIAALRAYIEAPSKRGIIGWAQRKPPSGD